MSERYIPRALRDRVAARARHRCGYCLTQETIVGAAMEIDHIVPASLGGATVDDNLWLACASCNEYKGNRVAEPDPLSGVLTPLFDPRRQVWNQHFAWSEDGAEMLGLTRTGRATVVALRLNRPLLVQARRLWVAAGWHPPVD